DIEKVAIRSSLRSLKPKCIIESGAKRSSINLISTLFQFACRSHTVKTRIIIRVLRIILVVLPEHQSDTVQESHPSMEAMEGYLYHHLIRKYAKLTTLVPTYGGMVNYGHEKFLVFEHPANVMVCDHLGCPDTGNPTGLTMSQRKDALERLQHGNVLNAKPAITPLDPQTTLNTE
ncbi:hypothetical protein Tco_1101398, partial [Tanacetum coccineum]